MTAEPHPGASQLADVLRDLHKTLIAEVQRDFEATGGSVGGPVALYQLLTGHPFFAWLRPLSRLMADLDELLERDTPLTPAEITSLRERVEAVLRADQYVALLQRSAELVMAHATLRLALGKL